MKAGLDDRGAGAGCVTWGAGLLIAVIVLMWAAQRALDALAWALALVQGGLSMLHGLTERLLAQVLPSVGGVALVLLGLLVLMLVAWRQDEEPRWWREPPTWWRR